MDKLKEVLQYIVKNYPYKNELSNARLTKIIYLADWHQAINHQKQITSIKWYFDNFGPFVFDVINKVKECSELFEVVSTTNTFGNDKQLVKLRNTEGFTPGLAQNEKSSLDHIIEITKTLNWSNFIQLVYSTYPITSSNRYSDLDLVEKATEYKEVSENS